MKASHCLYVYIYASDATDEDINFVLTVDECCGEEEFSMKVEEKFEKFEEENFKKFDKKLLSE